MKLISILSVKLIFNLQQAAGFDLDLTEKGLGIRSRRYAAIVDDGTVYITNYVVDMYLNQQFVKKKIKIYRLAVCYLCFYT